MKSRVIAAALGLLWLPSYALATCGDGIAEPTEACDDGNAVDGDGCSTACEVESGFVCECAAGEPLVLTPTRPTGTIGGTTALLAMAECPEGQVLQGITGTFIDNCPGVVISVDLLCAEATTNTADGSLILSPGSLVPGARPDASNIDLPQSSYMLTCPEGQAVVGFVGESGIAVPFDARRRAGVSELELQCADVVLVDGEIQTTFAGLAGPPVAQGNPLPGDTTITCDPNEIATGVAGWGGSYLDGARIMCSDAEPACSGGEACRPIGVCGDGIVENGESCDDGNSIDWDDCTNGCELPACGDGILSLGEACDDGDDIDDNECSNSCFLTGCGNGILETGEECDDGNLDDGDGCNLSCLEECVPGEAVDVPSLGRTLTIAGLTGLGSTDGLSVTSGTFDFDVDSGTATWVGEAADVLDPTVTWDFSLFFTFRGMGAGGAGSASPFLPRVTPSQEEIDAFMYFDTVVGDLIADDGRRVELSARPEDGSLPVQVGYGANTYTLDYGLAGMFAGPLYDGDGQFVRVVEVIANANMEPLNASCALAIPCTAFFCEPYEICDGVDNDGDGEVDEGFTSSTAYTVQYTNFGDILDSTIVYNPFTQELEYSIEVLHEGGDPADAFTLAINDGGNPKGHGDLSLLYFDATGPDPVMTAYAYNGLNGATSFMDGAELGGVQPPDPILGINDASQWIQEIYTVDTGTSLQMGFRADVTLINSHVPLYQGTWDWYGIGVGERAGQWLHVFNNVSTTYDAAGFLTTFNAMGSNRFIDTGNDRTDEETTCPPLNGVIPD